jgi:hypothetical protein
VRGLPWKEWSTKNPPAFLRTAKGSRDDKGDVYLDPDEFGPLAGSTVIILNDITQVIHYSIKSRRNFTVRYLIRTRRIQSLICKQNNRSVPLGFYNAFSSCYVHTGRSLGCRLYHCLWCCIAFFWATVLLTLKHLAILEVVRSEKKRKMENATQFGFHDYTFDLISVDYFTRKNVKKKQKTRRTAKVIQSSDLFFRLSMKFMFSAICTARIPGRRSQRR